MKSNKAEKTAIEDGADIYVLPTNGEFNASETKTFRKAFLGGYDKRDVDEYVQQVKARDEVLSNQITKLNSSTNVLKEEKELLKQTVAQKEELIESLLMKADEAEKLAEKNAGLQDVLSELTQQIAEFETAKQETATEIGKLKAKVDYLSSTEEKLEASQLNNDKLKIQLEQMQQEARVAAEQHAELKADIAYLRELNQRQSYDFAIKQERIETQMVENRSDYIKRLQMYAYHVKRSEEALKVLNEEISKAEYALRREETIDTY